MDRSTGELDSAKLAGAKGRPAFAGRPFPSRSTKALLLGDLLSKELGSAGVATASWTRNSSSDLPSFSSPLKEILPLIRPFKWLCALKCFTHDGSLPKCGAGRKPAVLLPDRFDRSRTVPASDWNLQMLPGNEVSGTDIIERSGPIYRHNRQNLHSRRNLIPN